MKKKNLRNWVFGLIYLLFLFGCSNKPHPPQTSLDQDESPSADQIKRLFENDLESLEMANPNGLSDYDYVNYDRFKQLFSGYLGTDIKGFFDERIKIAITEKDEYSIFASSEPKVTSWHTDPDPKKNEEDQENEKKALLLAMNLSSWLWFSGLVEKIQFAIKVHDQFIPIESSRTGIMALGPGYRETMRSKYGEFKLPASYRHGILLHEARHSDCTGGVLESDLEIVRNVRNPKEFDDLHNIRKCTHKHVQCPEGHDLSGVYACDSHPWGAYTISAVYAEARKRNTDIPLKEWSILNATAIDMKSRILVDFNRMMRGEFGDPDMSHAGVM